MKDFRHPSGFFILTTVIMLLISTLRAQNTPDLESMLSEISADSLHQTVLDLQNFGSRFALREGGNIEVAEYIVDRLNAYGVTAAVDSFYESGNNWLVGPYAQWFYNVKGVLAAANPVDDSIVIIGAHLDAIAVRPNNSGVFETAPGADDNASGVAVMIEIARIFHLYNYNPGRDIHFMAYDAEELGLFGSVHDAWVRQDQQDRVVAMLNNDMVSYQPDDDWKVTLHWYDNAIDLLGRAAGICSEYTDIQPVIPPMEENDNARFSDSYSYYLQGFRSVFAIEHTFSTSYHTEHDVADSNNYAYHAHITRYNLAMLNEFAGPAAESMIAHAPEETLRVYPNPVENLAMVQFSLLQPSQMDISVVDMAGRCVRQWPACAFSAGANCMEMDFSELSPGIYFCLFRGERQSFVQKVVVR